MHVFFLTQFLSPFTLSTLFHRSIYITFDFNRYCTFKFASDAWLLKFIIKIVLTQKIILNIEKLFINFKINFLFQTFYFNVCNL